MPPSTLPVDLSRGYDPLPAQAAFHASKARFRCYGGAVGAGKTKAGSREAMRMAIMFPGSTGLIGNYTYRRLHDSTMRTFMLELEQTGLALRRWSRFNRSDMELVFWNGSRIWFRNLEDYEQFLGVELDWFYVDEGSVCPDDVFVMLTGRLRGTPAPNTGVIGPLRAWITTNPGPSPWIRRNFIDRSHPEYALFRAKTTDNPYLDDAYIQTLRQQFSGVWWKRFVEGDWSSFEGQVFHEWDQETHVIDGFRPDKFHAIFEGYDFGMRGDTHVVWIAVDESGEWPPVVFAEHAANETDVADHAKAVHEMRRFYKLDEGKVRAFGDPAGANRGATLTGSSWFHSFADHGIWIAPSVKDPMRRATRLAQLLSHRTHMPDGTVTPGILFDRRCRKTIESVVSLQYKEHNSRSGEDAPERFLDRNKHGFDALGYGLMPIEPPTDRRKPRLIPGVASYALPREEREERERVSVSPYGDEV
jgi:phage terminase large subunit